MEKKTEVVIVNYIEKMLGERREKIIESDEYIRQDIEDLKELEERYASMKIPYMFRRVIDDYIACMESKSERYARPGRPIKSQLLMSEASALIAVTSGPSFRPPR